MFSGVRNLDERIRGYMAQQAEGQLTARRQAVMDDLKSQVQSNPATAAKRIGQDYIARDDQGGSGVGALEELLRSGMQAKAYGPGDAQTLIRSTAEREAARNPLYNLQRMLSGESTADRVGQVATYGAIGSGVVAGLTAAGQGVAQLTAYLQQGQQAEAERQAPLA